MWDNGRPLEMLKTLRYDSVALQHIIDVDKYIASSNEGYDLCQTYMLYCSFCNKWVKNPCASAYFVGTHFLAVCGIIDQCGASEPAVVQTITDVDKYLVSETVDFDVCGKYAPFCALCDKSVPNPCATAYLRYKALGLDADLPKIEPIVTSSSAATAAAVTAYEPEISVGAQPYMPAEPEAVAEAEAAAEPEEAAEPEGAAAAGDGDAAPVHEEETVIPARRAGIKIATARRRLPVWNDDNGRVN